MEKIWPSDRRVQVVTEGWDLVSDMGMWPVLSPPP